MINKEEKLKKAKIKEFLKQYFVYRQTDPQIAEQTKQELVKLGATKPYYAEDKEERSIKFNKMLDSEENWIRQTILAEIQKYFLTKDTAETLSLFAEIKTYQSNLTERMRKMKEARENRNYSNI